MVRYSAPLATFAPACRRHMTKSERFDFDSNPLWTERGQVMWLLEQRSDKVDLLATSKIASELEIQQPAAVSALQQLRAEGAVGSRRDGHRQLWGTTEQLQNLEAADRRAEAERHAQQAHIREHNESMNEIRQQLEEVVAEHAVEVSSLEHMFPRRSGEPQPDQLMIHVGNPGEAAWLLGRLRRPAPDEGRPTEDEWSDYAGQLDDLLGCLTWAGWFSKEEGYWTDYDRESGPLLFTQLQRTCMAFEVEYQPDHGLLRLRPFQDIGGEWPEVFSMLDEEITIELGNDREQQLHAVTARAGESGLLDATRIDIEPGGPITLSQFLAGQYRDWIFEQAAADRDIPLDELFAEAQEDNTFSTYFAFMAGFVGRNVLPDCVPDAAALGIAAWCWRNETAVEQWHLPNDVLMARVNIAVTDAVQPHVDPFEGIDWASIKHTLTDQSLSLPDGRRVADLFGDGWDDVRNTVTAQLDAWQHLDEHVLGAQTTLRLLTIGGSTDYTRHWWGQGRWTAICRSIINDAIDAGIALPSPYDRKGPQALLTDLAEPQHIADDVLRWLIDIPASGTVGPYGLRAHKATRPLIRTIEPTTTDLLHTAQDE